MVKRYSRVHGVVGNMPEEDTSLAAGSRGRAVGYGSLSVRGFLWPAGSGCDYHADAGHGY